MITKRNTDAMRIKCGGRKLPTLLDHKLEKINQFDTIKDRSLFSVNLRRFNAPFKYKFLLQAPQVLNMLHGFLVEL